MGLINYITTVRLDFGAIQHLAEDCAIAGWKNMASTPHISSTIAISLDRCLWPTVSSILLFFQQSIKESVVLLSQIVRDSDPSCWQTG